jgi:beta-galactosidase
MHNSVMKNSQYIFWRLIISIFVMFNTQLVFCQTTISLNGQWKFSLAKSDKEISNLKEFFRTDFNTAKFQNIPVPSNWAVLGFEEPVYKLFKDDKASEGYYLKEFILPENCKNQRVLLHFGGVWSMADVWLNGQFIGNHGSGFTSFSFDITDQLVSDRSNILAVRVRQVSTEYKFDVNDDWSLGGIYRDVTLEATLLERWIDKATYQTTFDSFYKDADLKTKIMIADFHKSKLPGNYPLPGTDYEVLVSLKDSAGKIMNTEKLKIQGHTNTSREIPVCFHVNEPHQWNAEKPYLYQLQIELLEKGKATQTKRINVGFRQISTAGGVFRINGQAVKLRGVNRHDEHPDVGRATTRAQWIQDITLMKAANINYIRLSHYTPAKGFIELCDSMGMYLGNEVNMGSADDYLKNPAMKFPFLQRAVETVERDLNSPSIIYWSVGNEDPFSSFHLDAVRLVKSMDSTRPVLLPWRTEEWLPEEIDILAPHYWKPEEYDQLAGNSTRPIISTEYTHAFGNDGMGDLEACWKALTKYPAGTGAAVWMWADQGLKTPVAKARSDLAKDDKYLRLVDEGWDGVVDSYRNPTRDYWEVNAVYAQVYPAVDNIYFTRGQLSVDIPIQNDYDFTNLSSVSLKWSLHEDEKMLSSGEGKVNGEPHSVALFRLPVEKLNKVFPDKTYYVQMHFLRADSSEITCKSVELTPTLATQQCNVKLNHPELIKDELLTINSGNISYVFNPDTGELITANLNNKKLISGLTPVIWRKTDKCESYVSGGRQVRDASYLAEFKPNVLSWKVSEQNDKIIIETQVNYVADEKNSMLIDYTYTIKSQGTLDVHYQIKPKVQIPWLPVVGMSVETPALLNNLRWLGPGPYDAYPNKNAAAILGVWGGQSGSPAVTGNKMIHWAEWSGEDGIIRITGNAYMEQRVESPQRLNILSGVLGRPEKSRKAGIATPQLLTNSNEPFVGEFSIEFK